MKFYITTAIPYVNAAPHIGHALEFVQADLISRWHKLIGDEVCLLSGGDENALKNVQAAEKAGVDVKKYIDINSQSFQTLASELSVDFSVFQKGSDTEKHFPSSQLLWQLCQKNGDIYKKSYIGQYCVGCEAFYSPEDLNENGECPEHPGKKLDTVKEENYFFRLSNYQDQLIKLITSDQLKIYPDFRKNEVLSFLKEPLHDISISRTNERARNWGVPVPDDTSQKIYVWFDALNIYQSGIGFGWDTNNYEKWWPADVHVIGKGIIRFHAVYWPAFLLSAGLKLPKSLFVHGYFTVNGQKMSKTLGNVIDPHILITKYQADSLRYYLLREIPPYADGDFSEKRFQELYNADLANGLGNLVARTAKLASSTEKVIIPKETKFSLLIEKHVQLKKQMGNFRFDEALKYIFLLIKDCDLYLDKNEPWKKSGEKKSKIINTLIPKILEIASLLSPFLPNAAEKILRQFTHIPIKPEVPIFPRII
jgi:methionyl-tRNA synthetase